MLKSIETRKYEFAKAEKWYFKSSL
jgi:hypothetical protein